MAPPLADLPDDFAAASSSSDSESSSSVVEAESQIHKFKINMNESFAFGPKCTHSIDDIKNLHADPDFLLDGDDNADLLLLF